MIEIQKINMVRNQCKPAGIAGERLITALLKVPRENFLLEKYAPLAYSDGDWPSIDGDIIWRPVIQAKLLEAAQIQDQDRVIIIGSSYLAAVTSLLAGKVLALDGHNLLKKDYLLEIAPLQLETISSYSDYNKVILDKLLSEEELALVLTWKEPEIFYLISQGKGISLKLMKSHQNRQEELD